MRGRPLAVSAVAVAASAVMVFALRPHARGFSLVVRAADLQGTMRRVAELGAAGVTSRELQMPLAAGPLRARVYEPTGRARLTVILVPGLHASGVEEPRFVRLARELSASGFVVVTPDIRDLSEFAITPAITDAIESVAVWLASQRVFAPDGRVGLIGVSFSGGLSIVAAGRASLAGRLAYVLSFGGHADLPRVLRYLCTGVALLPAESESALSGLRLKPQSGPRAAPPPHDYGVAVILLGVAERLVPPAQVAPLRAAVRRFLQASAWDRSEKEKAAAEFLALRNLARTLPEPSATLLGYVNDRDVAHLGARLLPHIGPYGGSAALSPARSPMTSAPVFLLHGTDDNVIPAAEALHVAAALSGVAKVRLLLTALITHAEADQPPRIGDLMELASFWGDVLGR